LIIWAVISIIIREAFIESFGQSLGAIIWISEWCWSLLLWNSLDHHANGDVVVVRWIFLLISILFQNGVEGVVSNNLSETLKSNRLNSIEMVGWGNLEGNSLNLIDWDVNWHGVGIEIILSLGLNKVAGSWSVSMDGSSVMVGLNKALSMWLVLFVVVLLSLLVMLSVLVTSLVFGFSLFINEGLNVGLDQVLNLGIGEGLGARLSKSLLDRIGHSLNLGVHGSLRLGCESS